jgi:hypothetical protein
MEIATIDLLKTVGEVGSIGLLALYMVISDQKDKRYNRAMNNHLSHMEAATYESANANTKLASTLSALSTVIQGCPTNKLNRE